MERLSYLLVSLFFAVCLGAQETIPHNVMNRLRERPELLSAWNALSDGSVTTPAVILQHVKVIMASGDDEIRLIAISHKEYHGVALRILESSPPPDLSDSAFLAQAVLANALSNQPTPGGEEQASQRGLVGRLGQLLKKSLSTVGTAADGIKWEGETQAEVEHWLKALTKAILNDQKCSDAQRGAAMRLQSIFSAPTSSATPFVSDQESVAEPRPNPPPSVQPPAPKKASEAKPTTPPSEAPTSSTPWSIIVVLIVAASGLLWLLLKRRS